MIFVSRDSTDEELFETVYTWLALLEAGDYAGATESIRYGDNDPWDEDYLRKAITEYRQDGLTSDDQQAKITSYSAAKVLDHLPEPVINRYLSNDSGLIGAIDSFDLPINGYWSNLTADFVVWEGKPPESDCVLC